MNASARISTLVGTVVFALAFMAIAALPIGGQAPARRAILVSFDGFSEPPMRQFSDSSTSPSLWSMMSGGACAEASRPAFPSVTPVGHATIFTGAYANVTGIAAQHNGKLPLAQTTILDWVDGFSAEGLRAEPIWITAARQGLRVFSHMATQSPAVPGYPDINASTQAMARARAAATAALLLPNVGVVNVYNEKISDAVAIVSDSNPSRPTAGWRGLESLRMGKIPPREVAWAFGTEGDSLHALFYANDRGRAVVLASSRDVGRGVVAWLTPTDTSSIHGRPLARFFSEPLRVGLAHGRRTFVFARLFELSSDLSRHLLYISEARVIHANRPEIAASYDSAVHGTPGNGSDFMLQRGRLGPIAADGGTGIAEFRYLETSELLTRQFMRGTEWGWRAYRPQLEIDYLPQPDEALHTWYGYAHPSTPGVSAATRATAAAMLARAYTLVDLRLAQYRRLASETPGTMLFVTGEHGMRPTWARFKPNVVLHDAGLLALDASGRIDLSHTLAAATDGTWISVNRVSRKGGIVPNDSVVAVIDRAERALLAARDSAGRPIVTATWRAGTRAADSLGLGPPAGGDLYYASAPGLYPSSATRAPAVTPMPFPQGEHGFPSVDRDMQPLFCALGGDAVPHRYGTVRSIDIAPTVTDWLGIKPPADARGRSVLPEVRRSAPK